MTPTLDRPWITLRVRALIALGIVAVLFPAVGGSVGIARARSALLSQLERDQQGAAVEVAGDVGAALARARSFIDDLVARPALAAAARSRNVAATREELERSSVATSPFRTIAVFAAPGKQVLAHPFPLSSASASVIRASSARTFAPRAFHDDAIQQIRQPIRGATAFVVAELSLNRTTPIIRRQTESLGKWSVIDRGGHVLVSSDARLVGATLTARDLMHGVAAGNRKGSAVYFESHTDTTVVSSFARVPGLPGAVVVAQPKGAALAPIQGSLLVIALALIGMIAVGLAITLIVVQALDRYDRRLSERLTEQERLNRALEGFSRHVAHDLRTPLAVIQLASQTVDRETSALSEGARKAAGMIGKQAVRATELIEDLLSLARASGTPKLEPIDLEDLVKDAARDVEGLDLRLERPLPSIVGDRASLRQAIANLFQNASRYARVDECARVSFSCSQGNGEWLLSVADTGPGLPAAEVKTVFEPFKRGAAQTSQHGSGLGLAIVAATAQAHGGRAWYEPRDGGGSVFRIGVPVVPQPAPTADAE